MASAELLRVVRLRISETLSERLETPSPPGHWTFLAERAVLADLYVRYRGSQRHSARLPIAANPSLCKHETLNPGLRRAPDVH